jgi:anti-anti-sigma factor
VEAYDGSADSAPAVISLSGELDAADASWADEIATALDAGCDRLVIDLLNVTFIDSSVVRELILAQRRVGADGWIHLVYTHHLISRVIQICGLADTFPQFTTVAGAVRSAPTRTAAHRSAASGAEMRRAQTERDDSVRRLERSSDPLSSSGRSGHDER